MSQWSSMPVRRIHPSVASLVFAIQAHDCYVAGGYARWACSLRENTPPPTDIDIICPSPKKLESLRASFRTNGFTEVRESEFSITFKSSMHSHQIQLLKLFTGDTLQECLAKFDLSVCRVALINHDSAIGEPEAQQDELQAKVRVRYVDPTTAVNTMCRLLRYANKGYDVPKAEVDKVIEVIRADAIKTAGKSTPSSVPAPSYSRPSVSAYDVGS